MKPRIVIYIFCLGWLLTGCGDEEKLPPAGSKVKVGNDGVEIELTAEGIRSYVSSSAYKGWIAEPKVHDSTQGSPHGKVRVYFNRISEEALRAKTSLMPVGSMLVKELYKTDGTTLDGYAVMVKHTSSSWTWWEAFLSNLNSPVLFGVDSSSCKGCHSSGANQDQVRSPLP